MNAEGEHEEQSLRFSIAQLRAELEHAAEVGGDQTAIKMTLRWFERSLAKLLATS
jgi:hypothetical protein